VLSSLNSTKHRENAQGGKTGRSTLNGVRSRGFGFGDGQETDDQLRSMRERNEELMVWQGTSKRGIGPQREGSLREGGTTHFEPLELMPEKGT